MGSWNGTCGFSNLPIYAGLKCKLFILIQNHCEVDQSPGLSSPTDAFSVYALPITGEYDDYGMINHIEENWNNQYIVDKINEDIKKEVIKVKPDYNEIEVNSFNSIEEVIEAISNGFLTYIDNYNKNQLRITFMLVLDDVYKLAIEIYNKLYGKLLIASGNDDIELLRGIFTRFLNGQLPKEKLNLYGKGGAYILSLIDFYHINNFQSLIPYLTQETLQPILNSYKESIQIYGFMVHTRRAFFECNGTGSQYDDLNLHIDFLNGCTSITEKLKTYFD
jgi:hypothetical protein